MKELWRCSLGRQLGYLVILGRSIAWQFAKLLPTILVGADVTLPGVDVDSPAALLRRGLGDLE